MPIGLLFYLAVSEILGHYTYGAAIRYFWVKILFGEFDSFGKDKIFSKSDNCGLKVTKSHQGGRK